MTEDFRPKAPCYPNRPITSPEWSLRKAEYACYTNILPLYTPDLHFASRGASMWNAIGGNTTGVNFLKEIDADCVGLFLSAENPEALVIRLPRRVTIGDTVRLQLVAKTSKYIKNLQTDDLFARLVTDTNWMSAAEARPDEQRRIFRDSLVRLPKGQLTPDTWQRIDVLLIPEAPYAYIMIGGLGYTSGNWTERKGGFWRKSKETHVAYVFIDDIAIDVVPYIDQEPNRYPAEPNTPFREAVALPPKALPQKGSGNLVRQ